MKPQSDDYFESKVGQEGARRSVEESTVIVQIRNNGDAAQDASSRRGAVRSGSEGKWVDAVTDSPVGQWDRVVVGHLQGLWPD